MKPNEAFTINACESQTVIRLLENKFGNLKGYWEKGNDKENCWVDYVIYNGQEKDFDLTQIQQAVYAFALSFGNLTDHVSVKNAHATISNNILEASWDDLAVQAPVKPVKCPGNL